MLVTLETLKAQLGGIQAKLDWRTVEPFATAAERTFGLEIGPELYADLDARPAADPLRTLAQGCISWMAYDTALPHLKLRVGDLGLMKSAPPNSTPVTKWEYLDTREAVRAQIDAAHEQFYTQLDAAPPAGWLGSEAYRARQALFIRSFDDLARFVPLAGGRRFFAKLLPFVTRAESRHLRGVLTPGVFRQLKAAWQGTDPRDDATAALLELVQEATATLALHEAFPYLPLKVDEWGFSSSRDKDGAREELVAEPGQLNSLRQQLYQDSQYALSNLRAYLDATASPTRWPEYYAANRPTDDDEDDDFTTKPHVVL